MLAGSLHTPPPVYNVRCSKSSPVPCGGKAIAGSIVFLGQDSSMDVYIITTSGIYRVIPPGLCAGAAPPRCRSKCHHGLRDSSPSLDSFSW